MDIKALDVYPLLVNAIEKLATNIQLPRGYSQKMIKDALQKVNREKPKFFYLRNKYKYDQDKGFLWLSYTLSEEQIKFFQEQIKNVLELDFRLDYVRTMSQLEQVEYIFQWLIQYTNYNPISAFNQSILSVFVMRNSLCTGYAKAVKYLCDALGLESKIIFGQLHFGTPLTVNPNERKDDSRHCWNLVKVKGVWYHLDVSLGDSKVLKKIAPNSNLCETIKDGKCWGLFCVSTQEILKTHTIEPDQNIPLCPSSLKHSVSSIVKVLPTLRTGTLGCQISTAGSSSKVYLSTDFKDRVVKVVESQDSKKFISNEISSYGILEGYENIIRFYGSKGNEIELEQVTPLTNLLKCEYFFITPEEILSMAVVFAETVKHCFKKGLAYRDIHIGNIFVNSRGKWLIGDFGHCVPVTKDNIYPDKVGNEPFISKRTAKEGYFDPGCAVYSIFSLIRFLYKVTGFSDFINSELLFVYQDAKEDCDDKLERFIEGLRKLCYGVSNLDICCLDQAWTQEKHNFYRSVIDDASSTDLSFKPLWHKRIQKNQIDNLASTANSDSNFEGLDRASAPTSSMASVEDVERGKVTRETYIPEAYGERYCTLNQDFDRCQGQKTSNSSSRKESIFKRIANNLFGKKDQRKNHELEQEPVQTVNSCVYAPAEVKRDDYMLVQVYLYRDKESEEVREKAKMVDKTAELRQYKPLQLPIKNGDKVRVLLKMRDSEIELGSKELYWHGFAIGCEFEVYIPSYAHNTILGTVNIFINDLPAGEMLFRTSVIDGKPADILTEVKSQRFDKVFVSYSHTDQEIVRRIVEGLRIANLDYFFDRHTLKPGDKFRDIIEKWIENSDVFVLCWSENAAKSVEVEKEMLIALNVSQRNNHLRIYPLSIEPRADLPPIMKDTYNFSQLKP